jgi:hypothetical protein
VRWIAQFPFGSRFSDAAERDYDAKTLVLAGLVFPISTVLGTQRFWMLAPPEFAV